MMSFLKSTGIIIIALTFSVPTLAGTLHIWTDENGVTHMTNQPPPEGTEHDKMGYKKPTVKKQHKVNNLNYIKKQEEYSRIQRENRAKAKSERQERQQKIEKEVEKQRQKREVESAKREYEYLKGEEDTYRAYYHEATTSHYRDYWYKKMKSVDEAYSKYIRLKNKYGQ